MNSEGCFAILSFLFGRREIRGIPTATVTTQDSVVAPTSASASSSTQDSLVASTSASASSSTQDSVVASTSASASSSTQVSAAAGVYEVFLSFCGKDTRKGFTDFLYTYLVGASIHTFRDDNELRVGEQIGPELLKAIQESKISIPIFSKNYASSKWCLLELAQMVECHKNGGQMIYPIFYDVDPSNVQNQKGSYEEAFLQHETKFDKDTVQSWRDALRKVGKLKGLELKKETDGREGELVKIVVEKVLLELKKNYTHVPKNLVGMGNHIEKLKGLLKVDSNGLRIVGIHGMGGLGKTTIAKVIYNQLCEDFEGHCFLDDVRENSRPRDGIVKLQNQLISKILKREYRKFTDANEGSKGIKDVVHGRKVLIVLDDVDEISQVNMLMGDHSSFGALSRIIITTRNTKVLDEVEMACQSEDPLDVYARYGPDFMDGHHSLQLFSKYAFMRDSPMEGYEFLSKEVVSIAAGLPLVLVVLGSAFLVVKDKDLWKEKLRKLRVIPHKEVLQKLRFSFDVLENEQQHIFLDIACLFIGRDKTLPCYMWDDCGFYPREGISVLVSRSLITVGDDNVLRMHDQLRDLGRQIVREEGLNEPGKRSRLWFQKEAMHVLETRQGTSRVNALCLPYEESDDPEESDESDGPEESDNPDDPEEYDDPDDPEEYYDLEESDGPEESARCLVAQDFHDLRNLRHLILGNHDLDGDLNHLFSNLRWLKWKCSGKFKPTNFHMKNLVILDLSFSRFTDDWEGWSQLKMAKKLKCLNLSSCINLRVVPHLSTFASLEILKLNGCHSLCRLDGLEQLKSLRYLSARLCYALKTLPSLSNLTKLVKLNLAGGCANIIEIQGLENLKSLQVLDIRQGYCLRGVPDLSNKLKVLHASCLKITEIPGLGRLESLERLHFSFLNLVKKLQDLSNLKKLKRLKIFSCDKLIEFQGLQGMESLERLSIWHCLSIERLPDLPNFGMLKVIQLSHCNKLHEVEGLRIESLEILELSSCDELREIPNLRSLKILKKLKICFLKELIEIHGLEDLKSLELLDIRGCRSIERLPDFSSLANLIKLNISGCVKLTEIWGLEELKSLKKLCIYGCERLRNLPDLPNTTINLDPTDDELWEFDWRLGMNPFC